MHQEGQFVAANASGVGCVIAPERDKVAGARKSDMQEVCRSTKPKNDYTEGRSIRPVGSVP